MSISTKKEEIKDIIGDFDVLFFVETDAQVRNVSSGVEPGPLSSPVSIALLS